MNKILFLIALSICAIFASCAADNNSLKDVGDTDLSNNILDIHLLYADCIAGFNKPIITHHMPQNVTLMMLSKNQEDLCQNVEPGRAIGARVWKWEKPSLTSTHKGVSDCVFQISQWFKNKYNISYAQYTNNEVSEYLGWTYALKVCKYIGTERIIYNP